MFAHPDGEVAVVNEHDPADNRNLGRHSPGDERSTVHHQNAVGRMGDFEVGEVARSDFMEIALFVILIALGMRVD